MPRKALEKFSLSFLGRLGILLGFTFALSSPPCLIESVARQLSIGSVEEVSLNETAPYSRQKD
jgi:hypothetical protein